MRSEAYVCGHSCKVMRCKPPALHAAVARVASLPDITEVSRTAPVSGRPCRSQARVRIPRVADQSLNSCTAQVAGKVISNADRTGFDFMGNVWFKDIWDFDAKIKEYLAGTT